MKEGAYRGLLWRGVQNGRLAQLLERVCVCVRLFVFACVFVGARPAQMPSAVADEVARNKTGRRRETERAERQWLCLLWKTGGGIGAARYERGARLLVTLCGKVNRLHLSEVLEYFVSADGKALQLS